MSHGTVLCRGITPTILVVEIGRLRLPICSLRRTTKAAEQLLASGHSEDFEKTVAEWTRPSCEVSRASGGSLLLRPL